jgi:capsule polysaccharide modification protein KpsS
VNKAELHEKVEEMTDEEAADAVLVYAPDWPDKITPIAEVIARRRGVELPTFEDGTPQPDWVALLRETRDGPRR